MLHAMRRTAAQARAGTIYGKHHKLELLDDSFLPLWEKLSNLTSKNRLKLN
jgi:hypothetical protein